jgi:hypothetical protein
MRTPAQRLLLMRFIWGASVVAIVPYTVCFVMWQRTGRPIAGVSTSILRFTFWGLALYDGWASFRRRRLIVDSPPAQGSEPSAMPVDLRNRCLVVWAMSESVAIFGLMLGFFTHNVLDYAPFAVASLSLLYIHRPWSPPFRKALQIMSDATWPEKSQVAAIREQEQQAKVRDLMASGRSPRILSGIPLLLFVAAGTGLGVLPFALIGWAIAGGFGIAAAVALGIPGAFLIAQSMRTFRRRVEQMQEPTTPNYPAPSDGGHGASS